MAPFQTTDGQMRCYQPVRARKGEGVP